MEIFSLPNFIILVIAALFQTDIVDGYSNSVCGGIFERDAGEFENPHTKFPVSWSSLKQVSKAIEVSICPDDSTISPCTCSISSSKVSIHCLDSLVNQTSVEIALGEVRRVNQVAPDRGIQMDAFYLMGTNMTQLDMSPFYGSQINFLIIKDNPALTKLVNSGNPQDYGSIHARRFDLSKSPMDRPGLGDIFKYFSNEMTVFYAVDLSFYKDNISDEDGSGSEFLPGFSTHTNLQELYVWNRSISGRLDSDTWIPKELQSLKIIDFRFNHISEIGENVFYFIDRADDLRIDLLDNELNESSFHPNSGISRTDRPTNLWLPQNQITSLPAPIFETFLDAHPQNYLNLWNNRLICDERLSWIKARRDEFQSRVDSAYCYNDQSHTVFDSNLIP